VTLSYHQPVVNNGLQHILDSCRTFNLSQNQGKIGQNQFKKQIITRCHIAAGSVLNHCRLRRLSRVYTVCTSQYLSVDAVGMSEIICYLFNVLLYLVCARFLNGDFDFPGLGTDAVQTVPRLHGLNNFLHGLNTSRTMK
jgi:hypothetical protein